jgi:predicted metal-dependent phosphoesterase TrpH
MKAKIDMHIHSIYSDGILTPLEILDVCNKNNVNTLSITDHNNILGVREAILNNPYKHIRVISGIEFDADYRPDASLHILGYNMSLDNKQLNETCSLIMEESRKRLESLIFHLKKSYNLTFKEEDIEAIFSSKGNVGRPDIANLCYKYGYTSTMQEAFKKFFAPISDKVAKKNIVLQDYECIKLIKDAGGVPCLAHPNTLKKTSYELKEYLKELKRYGLVAVEVYHSNHSNSFIKILDKITVQVGLLKSSGSDYHSPLLTVDVEIGNGKNGNLDMSNMSNFSILSKIGEKL